MELRNVGKMCHKSIVGPRSKKTSVSPNCRPIILPVPFCLFEQFFVFYWNIKGAFFMCFVDVIALFTHVNRGVESETNGMGSLIGESSHWSARCPFPQQQPAPSTAERDESSINYRIYIFQKYLWNEKTSNLNLNFTIFSFIYSWFLWKIKFTKLSTFCSSLLPVVVAVYSFISFSPNVSRFCSVLI